MNIISKSALAAVVCIASGIGLARPADAQVVVNVPFPIIAPPPPVFVATSRPVYYEGHASYWYGDHWVWRDGRGWHGYDHEPTYLHEYRGRPAPPRHYYEGHRR